MELELTRPQARFSPARARVSSLQFQVRGFSQVVMCSDVDHGLGALIQTAGLGGLCPNTVMIGWSRHWREFSDRYLRRGLNP